MWICQLFWDLKGMTHIQTETSRSLNCGGLCDSVSFRLFFLGDALHSFVCYSDICFNSLCIISWKLFWFSDFCNYSKLPSNLVKNPPKNHCKWKHRKNAEPGVLFLWWQIQYRFHKVRGQTRHLFLFVHFQKIILGNNWEDMFANKAEDMRNCTPVAAVVASEAVEEGS